MSGWNLPPGVSVNDIPGNRPEDIEYDKIEANVLEDIRCESFYAEDVLHAVGTALFIDNKLMAAIGERDEEKVGKIILDTLVDYLCDAAYHSKCSERR